MLRNINYLPGGFLIDNRIAEHGVDHASPAASDRSHAGYHLRAPDAQDALEINALIAACPPLDTNSLYCNLLQCTHFAETCILAERDGAISGWISGYRPSGEPDALFIWQVAVHERARGAGLAMAMLDGLHARPAMADIRRLITTVTPSNLGSRRLFSSFARRHGAELAVNPHFDRDTHFGGAHESEELISVAPLRWGGSQYSNTTRKDDS